MIAGRHFTVLRKASVQWKMETHAQSQSKERTMRMVTTYAVKGRDATWPETEGLNIYWPFGSLLKPRISSQDDIFNEVK